jgi:hypothetical protein
MHFCVLVSTPQNIISQYGSSSQIWLNIETTSRIVIAYPFSYQFNNTINIHIYIYEYTQRWQHQLGKLSQFQLTTSDDPDDLDLKSEFGAVWDTKMQPSIINVFTSPIPILDG